MKQYRLMHMLLLVAMLLAGVSCTNDLSEELQTSATPLGWTGHRFRHR